MNEKLCITSKEWQEVCERIKACEVVMVSVSKGVERIEAALEEQRKESDKIRSDARNDKVYLQAQWDEKFTKKTDEDEKRFSNLELWRAWLTGIMVVISAIMGIIGTSVWNYYTNFSQVMEDKIQQVVESQLK